MMTLPRQALHPIVATASILLLLAAAAHPQSKLSTRTTTGDSVKVVGQLPPGMSVRGGRLSLPSGYRLTTSGKTGNFNPTGRLTSTSGGTRSGSGTIECDGCCDVATTGTPPKAYCSKTGNCGCITTITIK